MSSRSISFYRRLALLFALLATSSSTLALSLHDLDPEFERCEAIKSQHSATLPAKSDPFWSLEKEQQTTVLIYLHEKSMERCTAAEVDVLALKALPPSKLSCSKSAKQSWIDWPG